MVIDAVENVNIVKIKDQKEEITTDEVVVELPLTIYLNNEEIATLLCTPQDVRELAVGFLSTGGFVFSAENIKSITYDNEKMCVWVNTTTKQNIEKEIFSKRVFTSGCARGIMFWEGKDFLIKTKALNSNLVIKVNSCFSLYEEFNQLSFLYKTTGGVHSAAISDKDKILSFKEDIGRHNAVDKVLGECILKNISTLDKIILTSGRISSEIVIKCARGNIPIIISSSAPTSLAIKIAENLNLTIVGFLRGKRMSIYTHRERVENKINS